jgi:AcrR family transcriptional regulator
VKVSRERILDVAERLFAERGFASTSLRALTAAAGVNLAAVHYHFGSKDDLIAAVLERRLVPLQQERVERLEACLASNGTAAPRLEDLLEAFVGPALRLSHAGGPGGGSFMRLLGRIYVEPDERALVIVRAQFQETVRRFAGALALALPELHAEEVFWNLHFTIGSMAYTMTRLDGLVDLSGGVCDTSDVEEVVARLVAFSAAGIRAGARTEPSAYPNLLERARRA